MSVRLPPALSVEGLSYSYGPRRALDDVTFSIAPATFTVLLGLNGAGKTTLFSLIARLYAAAHGRIRVFGHDTVREPGAALRQLGIVFQARTLDLDLSIMQNLVYHAALHGIDRAEARARAAQLLEGIALADRARDKVRHLSGGQMRRVEIVRALLHRPQLLVLDEPTVGLDIAARADLIAHVRHLVADEGVCVLWATHLVDEIVESDDVIVLHQGRVLAHGGVPQILAEHGRPDIGATFSALTGPQADVAA